MINYTRVVKFIPNIPNQVPSIFFITDTDESKRYICKFSIDGSEIPKNPILIPGLSPLSPYGSFAISLLVPHDYPTNDAHEPSFHFDGIHFYCPSPFDEKYISKPGLVRYIMNTWMETLVFTPSIVQNNKIQIKLNDITFPVIFTSYPVITISPHSYEFFESPDENEFTILTFDIISDDILNQDQTINWKVSKTDLENNIINNFIDVSSFGDEYPSGSVIILKKTKKIQIQISVKGNTLDIDRNFYVILSTDDTNIVVDPFYGSANVKIKKFIHSRLTLKYKSNLTLFDYLAPLNVIEGNRTGELTYIYFTVSIDKPLIRTSEQITWQVLPTGLHPVNNEDFFNNELPTGIINIYQNKLNNYNFVVQINQDFDVEFDETFRVIISEYSPGLSLGIYNYVDVIIKNDDYSYLSIPNEMVVNEGDILYIPILISRPFVLNSSVEWYIDAKMSNGTNVIIDYPPANVVVIKSGIIKFDPLASFDPLYNDYYIELKINNDIIYNDCRFYVNLKNPTGNMKLGNNITTLVTIINLPNAKVSINDLTGGGIYDGFVGQITPYPFSINLNRNVDFQQKVYWQVIFLGSGQIYAQVKDFTSSSVTSGYILTQPNILTYQINNLKVIGPNKPTKDRTFKVELYNPSNHLDLDDNYYFTGLLMNDHLIVPAVSIIRTSSYSITPPNAAEDGSVTYITWSFKITTDLSVVDDEWVDWEVSGVDTNGTYPVNINDFYQETNFPKGRVNFYNNVPTENIVNLYIASNNTVQPTRTFQITLTSCSDGISINTNSEQIKGEIIAVHFNPTIIANFTVTPIDVQYIREPISESVILPFTIIISDDVVYPESVFWTVESVGAVGVDSVIPSYFTYSDIPGNENKLPQGSVEFKFGTKSIDVKDLKVKSGIHLQRNASLQISLSVDPVGMIKSGQNKLIAAIIQPS